MNTTSEPSTEKALTKVSHSLPDVLGEAESAKRFIEASRAPSTRRAYRSDWRIFSSWCESRGISPLPASAEAVCLFLAAQAEAGIKASTLGRRVASIRLAHTSANLEPPTSSESVRIFAIYSNGKSGTKTETSKGKSGPRRR